MPALELDIAQRKQLRADANFLNPVVFIGSDGLTSNVIKEIDNCLNAHSLIKIRVFSDDKEQRQQFLLQISDQLNAAPVQHIGKLLVLYRPITEKISANLNSGTREVKFIKYSKRGGQRPEVKRIKLTNNERLTSGGKIKRVTKRKSSVKKTSK